MPPRGFTGPKLPRNLLDEVGGAPKPKAHSQRHQQRVPKANSRVARRSDFQQQRPEEEDFDGFSDGSDSSRSRLQSHRDRPAAQRVTDPPTKRRKLSSDESEKPRKVPSRVVEKLAEDDDEISRLQKKLGIKSKKLPKSFDEEGLGGLLGDLDDGEDVVAAQGSGRTTVEDRRWLRSKRSGAEESLSESSSEMNELESDADELSGSDENAAPLNRLDSSNSSLLDSQIDSDEDLGVSNDELDVLSTGDAQALLRKRENPFIPPVESTQAKYVPPSRRTVPASDDEARARLRRQIQGSLNKLSESNMMSIVNEIEKQYASNPRQYVHTTIIELVINLLNDPASLNTTFLVLHAAFLAAFYRIVGADFGAQCVEQIVQRTSERPQPPEAALDTNKQTLNLLSILSHLYNFGVVSSNLIFDYIREFVHSITEIHTELLLRVIRSCGFQLRQDDPGAIKEIAMTMQKKVGVQGENTSVRTRFMVDEIAKLRDNKNKQSLGTGDIAELVTRYRKSLGALSSRNVRSNPPMTIGLQDIRNSDKKGKWWLVGASWSGHSDNRNETQSEKSAQTNGQHQVAGTRDEDDETSFDLTNIAKQHHMNTDIRRAIFITIMSASDYSDAHTKLLKLNLTRSQELQIPHVLLHCVSTEQRYNPYYMLISRKLCKNHKLRMAFHFALWDLFKRMERGEDNDAGEEVRPEIAL